MQQATRQDQRRALYLWVKWAPVLLLFFGVLFFDTWLNTQTRNSDYELCRLRKRMQELATAFEDTRAAVAGPGFVRKVLPGRIGQCAIRAPIVRGMCHPQSRLDFAPRRKPHSCMSLFIWHVRRAGSVNEDGIFCEPSKKLV